MENTMNKKMLKVALSGLVLLVSGFANAGLITRVDFDAGATEFDFTGLAANTVNAGDGNLSISNGTVALISAGGVISPSYYDGNDASVIRFDFTSLVSAFGLDFYSNNQDTTLSLFDVSNNLIESLTITTSEQYACNGYLCGYVGLDIGSNLISYVTIDTPLIGNELYIDNIIYQTATDVPEPSTLAIFALGVIGVASRRSKGVSKK